MKASMKSLMWPSWFIFRAVLSVRGDTIRLISEAQQAPPARLVQYGAYALDTSD